MVGWSEAQEAIRVAIATAIAVPDRVGADSVTVIREVDWEDRADAGQRWFEGGVRVDLSLGPVRVVGWDETHYNVDEDAETNTTVSIGYRVFAVTVKIVSDSQEPGSASVGELAGRVRLRLRAPRIRAIYQEENVALVSVNDTFPARRLDINGRMQSVSVQDIYFSTYEVWEDIESNAGWIDSVAGDGDLASSFEGEELDAPFDTDP